MTEKQEELPDISMTNTKKEMLAAFNELKKQLEQKAEIELKPEKKEVSVEDHGLDRSDRSALTQCRFSLFRALRQRLFRSDTFIYSPSISSLS